MIKPLLPIQAAFWFLPTIFGDCHRGARAGIEYTVAQFHRYIVAGVNGLHLYTLNKWEKITEVLNSAGISN